MTTSDEFQILMNTQIWAAAANTKNIVSNIKKQAYNPLSTPTQITKELISVDKINVKDDEDDRKTIPVTGFENTHCFPDSNYYAYTKTVRLSYNNDEVRSFFNKLYRSINNASFNMSITFMGSIEQYRVSETILFTKENVNYLYHAGNSFGAMKNTDDLMCNLIQKLIEQTEIFKVNIVFNNTDDILMFKLMW